MLFAPLKPIAWCDEGQVDRARALLKAGASLKEAAAAVGVEADALDLGLWRDLTRRPGQ